MEAIKDSVHDHIPVGDLARDLLDAPEFQRLRHIKQLGTVRLVYPSANHTRFEHSLGVYHLAREALAHLGVDGERAKAVRAAAMLHDVGHGPYGHQTEGIIQRRLGRHHDEIGHLLAGDSGRDATRVAGEGIPGGPATEGDPAGDDSLATVLESHGLDPDEVAALVAGEGELGGLVAGELDVDRVDYLLRDAHHTGVPYGTIDPERLLSALRLRDGDLVLAAGNVPTAESVLVARALMNAAVYRHHTSRIAGAMLERASERLLDADATDLDPERFARMTDAELLAALRACETTAETAARLERRDLYKRAAWAELDAVPEAVVTADHETVRAFERDIAAAAGVAPDRVLVDTPGEPSIPESSTSVVVGEEVRRLPEESPLVEGVLAAGRAQWRFGVYAPERHTDAVGRAAERVLGVES
ncbi:MULTISPECIES: HD domain-containing protein [Halorussus]|uniref:HD domain-containing protein n=1 Tax=Halorussus TaxID=1070314 RepID=UPI00209D3F02|nr:HD domain-containing protein [Halorussus vallis]USZ73928.1 HD domain-containing protein [Halorussus vallis]